MKFEYVFEDTKNRHAQGAKKAIMEERTPASSPKI